MISQGVPLEGEACGSLGKVQLLFAQKVVKWSEQSFDKIDFMATRWLRPSTFSPVLFLLTEKCKAVLSNHLPSHHLIIITMDVIDPFKAP